MRVINYIAFLVLFGIILSCGSEELNTIKDLRQNNVKDEEQFAQTSSSDSTKRALKISKQLILDALYELNDALINKQYSKAASFFIVPNEMSQKMLEEEVKNILELQEISKIGIDVLSESANFGTIQEIYGDIGAQKAAASQLDPSKCYGLGITAGSTPIEVMCYWDSVSVRFFRLDNVGKLGL